MLLSSLPRKTELLLVTRYCFDVGVNICIVMFISNDNAITTTTTITTTE